MTTVEPPDADGPDVARAVVAATAQGRIVASREGLSFWGGVDPSTGRVIDVHHPLCGVSLAGTILLMPTSRGSCSGSGVLLDLALMGRSPAALVFAEDEDVLTLGALVAKLMFDKSVAVVRVSQDAFDRLSRAREARIGQGLIEADG